MEIEEVLTNAKVALAKAEALIFSAGAGMGVDSGLPDFRGQEGFWQAYPALAQAGLDFQEIADPQNFKTNPRLIWGFYGHRLNLYRQTVPHQGFTRLLTMAAKINNNYFVVTSNVDGHFQKALFPENKIYEVHGSIHYLQCARACQGNVWRADNLVINQNTIDENKCLWVDDLPKCPNCGDLARPNILMFNDYAYAKVRSGEQAKNFQSWHHSQKSDCVIVALEMGAGTAIHTIRHYSEASADIVIRINVREAQKSFGTCKAKVISIPMGALAALTQIIN